ncbi:MULTISPECIES: hypothetical protein [unclassified Bradyrhizobium]|uniref:hypothetical protein n=1 Tax=unclassified Bradyrhizobium TaxID=2631580 RepID=UPI0028F0FBC1|nr:MULTISPECIES: hypothetical protein [unclassified Bradyrhizobium]
MLRRLSPSLSREPRLARQYRTGSHVGCPSGIEPVASSILPASLLQNPLQCFRDLFLLASGRAHRAHAGRDPPGKTRAGLIAIGDTRNDKLGHLDRYRRHLLNQKVSVMWLLVAFMVVVVSGLNFIIERSSMTKSVKAVTRLAVLAGALATTFYLVI